MLQECADRIADVLSNNKVIKPEDKEIYVYGLDALLSTVINLAVIAALGIIMGVFAETVVFVLAFAVLRVYAGGYHAKTHVGCAAAFTAIYLAGMALQFLTPDNLLAVLTTIVSLVSFALIFVLAPIEHKNRPFEGDEFHRFKRAGRVVAGLEALTAIMGVIIIPTGYHLFYCISLGMINAVLILAIAKKIEVRGE